MNGDTPINVDEPQFTQREASEVSGAPMKTINNWLDREFFSLTQSDDRRLAGRRYFSIRNIVFLKAMQHCSDRLSLAPSLASQLANKCAAELGSWSGQAQDGSHFRIWYLAYRSNFGGMATDGWAIQAVWQHPKSGLFYQYAPALFGEDEPMEPMESAFITFPASRLGNTAFLAATKLLSDDPDEPDPMQGIVDDF